MATYMIANSFFMLLFDIMALSHLNNYHNLLQGGTTPNKQLLLERLL